MERKGIPGDKCQEYWNSRLRLEKGSNFHICSSQNSGTSSGTLLEIGVHKGKGGEHDIRFKVIVIVTIWEIVNNGLQSC